LEVQKDVLTGKIDGRNCYGRQKEARIREAINLADYSIVVAYGDTRGDKEMLAMASEAHYREV
jgi:phosphoserine phosphatase